MATTETNNYYDMARKQQFDDLYDAEIQLENAKNNAIKNTRATLANQGFLSSGYGNTLQSGIDNAYSQAWSGLRAQTQRNINDINMQEAQKKEADEKEALAKAEAEGENTFKNLGTLISTAQNQENIENLLKQYGYGDFVEDEKGNSYFAWNEEKPENMSNEDWAQLQYLYNEQMRNIAENTPTNYAVYSDYDSLSTAKFEDSKGQFQYTLGQNFKNQLDNLWARASYGQYNNGDVIELVHNGQNAYLQWTGNGFRMISKQQYEEESKNHDYYRIRGGDYASPYADYSYEELEKLYYDTYGHGNKYHTVPEFNESIYESYKNGKSYQDFNDYYKNGKKVE